MEQVHDHVRDWLTRPLCRSYVVAIVQTQSAKVGGCAVKIRWALGSLPNRDCEVLGVWLGADEGGPAVMQMLLDLQSRGVESVRFGLGDLDGSTAVFGQSFRVV